MPSPKKIILGGAQIGQEYGLVRKSSFSHGDGVQGLLDEAERAGFMALDTARTYGRSEEIIGGLEWKGEIHTKLDEYSDPEASLSQSLEALSRDSIEVLYVCHDVSRVSETSHEYWAPLFERLRTGAQSFGVAVYPEQIGSELLDLPEISVIQIPFNVLSPMHLRDKVAEWHKAGQAVFVRSVFAQGVLLRRDGEHLSPGLAEVISTFHDVAEKVSLDPAELALRWCLSIDDIDGIVLGVSQLDEVQSIAHWLGRGPLSVDEHSIVEEALEGQRRDIDLRGI